VAEALGYLTQHGDAGCGHFRADAITGQYDDLGLHAAFSM
jgi:hypothetical protein